MHVTLYPNDGSNNLIMGIRDLKVSQLQIVMKEL